MPVQATEQLDVTGRFAIVQQVTELLAVLQQRVPPDATVSHLS